MIRTMLSITLIMICLVACTMAPNYTRPTPPIPAGWPSGEAYKKATSDTTAPVTSDLTWQEFFTDERLQKVIEKALNNNRDLRIAALNVERARAVYGIQRAELLPTLNAVGAVAKQRISEDLSDTRNPKITEKYSADLGVLSWEIDLFGRIQSLKDKALEEYLATEYVQRGTQLSLISSVAEVYLALAADHEGLKLSQSTLEAQQTSYNLIKRRYDVGITNELDLRRAQTQVDLARRDVALYTQFVAQDKNALNLLVGSQVPSELLPLDLASVTSLKDISAGMSSDILLHRPDILAAEHRLKAANANIGAARAAFFPRIALTTTVGTASNELSELFKAGTATWTFAPQAVMPIFDFRLWSALRGVTVEREIALAQYEKSIQTAFRETADALAKQSTVGDQLAAQESLVQASTDTYRLSNARYTKGIDSYLSVLDAQRSLYSAETGLIVLRLSKLTNLVTLYKVLGGGADVAYDVSP
jgi:outer membrane protein, multidrug efflux system